MIFCEEADTEETLTCLHMTFYHPCQEDKMMFRCLNFCEREQVSANESATFGRDSNICRYNLMDSRHQPFYLLKFLKLISQKISSIFMID
uniref:Uncharacterized protein n=1 Tax=Nothoprocta perdicaria TaxID=30464 RepID=A0A8C7E8U7_NOTPE